MAQGYEEAPPDGANAPGLSEGETRVLSRQVADDIRAHVAAHGVGSVPAGLRRWADETLRPATIPWQRELAAAVRSGVSHMRGRQDISYARLSRRQGVREDIRLPAWVAPVPHVACVVDTSGSMGSDDLASAVSEVRGVCRALGAAVELLGCDTEATRAGRTTHARVALGGGGGTDMGEGIAAALRLRPRPGVVVVLTDGETPWPDAQPRAKVIVVLVRGRSSYPTPSWARVIEVRT